MKGALFRRRLRRGLRHMRSALTVKMTLLYGALFVAIMGMSLYATRNAIDHYADRTVRQEMAIGSALFARMATLQFRQLDQSATVLASDFGFRTAVGTSDAPTIASALDSLKRRFGIDHALFVSVDGALAGDTDMLTETESSQLYDALDSGRRQGIVGWRGQSHMVAAAPVRAPMLTGWVVFSRNMGPKELAQLAQLSAVDLNPRLLPVAALPAGLRTTKSDDITTREWRRGSDDMLVQARPVENLVPSAPRMLVLEYSLTDAMAAYAPILNALLAFGLIGTLLALWGAFVMSRNLARPIIALESAARKVSSGEHAQVKVETRDEIGRLARSFNRMVNAVEMRERQIAHMAFHDGLTGLANRTLLREQIALYHQRAGKEGFALFCLDLDNFKAVNDTLGHPVGDALLCDVAARLAQTCPAGFVARLGGDEFALLVDDGAGHADQIGRAIVNSLAQPFHVNGHRIVAGASVGIALAPQDGADATMLLKNADLALYRAKQDGKGSHRFFEPAMDAEAQARRAMEVDLHDALRNGELELHFQPLFGLSQNRVTAFEALLRWNHPVRGMVSPLQFIPLAEETGLIIPIGEWVIHEACRVAASWPDHIRIAVNVSPVQFRSSTLNSIVLQGLARSGLDPQRLELEITESLFIDNVEATLASLHSLRTLGVRVALDDFGTGYSSLSYLRSFPFDKLKIDRSFIVDLLAHEGATAIIRAITTLADALGMETTAEGVENSDQLDILRAQGCGQIQGYFFSKPIPAGDVAQLLQKLDQDRRAA
ncbi:EAL domain-containing protein [Sphingobium sp. HBC34]|uniref:EAL domain-containing protein n=1 Tax=Sphingobium cyanobacteriorum TaxID=3063954 RepID=A0ABT8ZN98_9SPHN|nr:EAL domain-containing protein [Sphingobium sp. HBC34]MDO7835598.1 EAL domain-containing protein [Sphingobium sp. HBC34]